MFTSFAFGPFRLFLTYLIKIFKYVPSSFPGCKCTTEEINSYNVHYKLININKMVHCLMADNDLL